MSKSFFEKWDDVVGRVARYVCHDYPDVEVDDIKQDLFEEVLKRGWTNPNAQATSVILRLVAKEQAAKYRNKHLILSPQYNYRISEVRKILERVFAYEDWLPQRGAVSVDDEGVVLPVDKGEPSYEMDETLVVHSDIKSAWEQLPPNYKELIFKRYALNMMPQSEAEEQQTRRALYRMIDILNSYSPRRSHDGPGSRRVINNAHARYITKSDYDPT